MTPLEEGYKMIVAALWQAGLPIGGTAAYPRLAIDTVQCEELEKGGDVCRITASLHCLSEDSMAQSFEMCGMAIDKLTKVKATSGGWTLVAVTAENTSCMNESIDTANTLYRATANINAIIER